CSISWICMSMVSKFSKWSVATGPTSMRRRRFSWTTFRRSSLRRRAYSSAGRTSAGAILRAISCSVGAGENLDGLRGLRRRRTAKLLHSLQDVNGGERAFRGDLALARSRGLSRHGPADLQRRLEVLLAHAPGSAMARAALDDLEVGTGDEGQ